MNHSMTFTPAKIGHLEIKNRLIRSATYENGATPHGEVTDGLVSLYRDLGKGGVGMIVTGIACVMGKFHSPHRSMRIDEDRFIPGLERISRAVHELGNDCKIMVQLHLPGRQVLEAGDIPGILPYFPPAMITAMQRNAASPAPETIPPADDSPHIEPVAPSALRDVLFGRTPRQLTFEEIQEIVDAFAHGISRAREAGFDGVQLHAAHGWLLSSFLSPHTNKRTDTYGGSTENRTRIVREIFEKGRKLAGQDFPILIKMNTTDFFPDGTNLEEAVRVAKMLEETGFSALEISGGMWETVTRSKEDLGFAPYMLPEARTGINRMDQEAYFLPAASAIKKKVKIPIILVGGLKSPGKIEEVLESGAVDFVSMSRALIRQPDLPRQWQSGEGSNTADCISCNACLPGGESIISCKQIQ
ncbi:MAG: NADH:flavin oxidoreductase [Proteobacteria bacterium]|nr:NADH:flavin oxidoreductase [Pseudomonadota bacterium]MBU4471453.1 NADH:flavin oxidoreductase [Pseudomonadota bacterium]MCG2752460.1 NADH:flavin oxidoreductase [Desulfobacteraceae bacterium]